MQQLQRVFETLGEVSEIVAITGCVAVIPSVFILLRCLRLLWECSSKRTQLSDYVEIEFEYIREPILRKTVWRLVVAFDVITMLLLVFSDQVGYAFWQLCHDADSPSHIPRDCVSRAELFWVFLSNCGTWLMLSLSVNLQRRLGYSLSILQQFTASIHAILFIVFEVPWRNESRTSVPWETVAISGCFACLQVIAISMLYFQDIVDQYVNYRPVEYRLCGVNGMRLAQDRLAPRSPKLSPSAIMDESVMLETPLLSDCAVNDTFSNLRYTGLDVSEVLVATNQHVPIFVDESNHNRYLESLFVFHVFVDPNQNMPQKEWLVVKRYNDFQTVSKLIRPLMIQARCKFLDVPLPPSGWCRGDMCSTSQVTNETLEGLGVRLQVWLQRVIDEMQRCRDLFVLHNQDPVLRVIATPLKQLSRVLRDFLKPMVFVDDAASYSDNFNTTTSLQLESFVDVALNMYVHELRKYKLKQFNSSWLHCWRLPQCKSIVVVWSRNTKLDVEWELDISTRTAQVVGFIQQVQPPIGPVQASGVQLGWKLSRINWVKVSNFEWENLLQLIEADLESSKRIALVFSSNT